MSLSLLLLLLLVLAASPWQARAAGGGRPRVPAILVFGDSIVDTGNNNAVLTFTKSNFRPYGKDLNGGVPTGRFSNGRIPTDFVASRLGLKDLVPAYLGTDLSDDDLCTGVSFASGGTGYDPLTSTLVVNNNRTTTSSPADAGGAQHVRRVQGEAGRGRRRRGRRGHRGRQPVPRLRRVGRHRQQLLPRPRQTSAVRHLGQLYRQGARRIAILGMPPVGCVPSQRTLAGGLARDCDPARNHAAQLYNSRLRKEVVRLQKELGCQRIGYVDIYDVLQDMITNPCRYGFEVSTRGCCGTGDFEVSLLCNQVTAPTCPDDRKYVFWDSFHPTEKAYEIIVDYLFPRYIENLL